MGLILAILIYVSISFLKTKTHKETYTVSSVLLFIVLLFGGMRYVISGEKLYLKMWFISVGSRNIVDIVSVDRSYNLISSPANSLKRLRICSKNSSILISPVREKEFIETLKAINPDIEVHIPEKTGIWRIWDWDI